MTKKEIITEIFQRCKAADNLEFDNDFVKKVMSDIGAKTNPYDMTKLDDTSKFPKLLLDEDYFIAHLGGGKHRFVKGIHKVFHKFESINEDEILHWLYRPSVLNDYSNSESSVLSLCFNHRVIHDFLYLDIVSNPKIYNSERKTKIGFDYKIADLEINAENLQIEIDLTTEYQGQLTVFEGKNAPPNRWIENFNVYQLYNPYRYYFDLVKNDKLDIKNINACYLIKQKQDDCLVLRLYLYRFENYDDITSLTLIKKREYHLKRRVINGQL